MVISTKRISTKKHKVDHEIPACISIKPSTIPEVGMGAFATTKIPKNEMLGEYKGERINRKQWEQRYPSVVFEEWAQQPDTIRFFEEKKEWIKNKKVGPRPAPCSPIPFPPLPGHTEHATGLYGMELSKNVFVDAEDSQKSNWTRYINSPFTSLKKRANCKFVKRRIFGGGLESFESFESKESTTSNPENPNEQSSPTLKAKAWQDQMWVQTIRQIQPREELFVHYGKDYFKLTHFVPL